MMATIVEKSSASSLAPFTAPLAVIGGSNKRTNGDGSVTDSSIMMAALSRGRNERKSIAATERRLIKEAASMMIGPQKSQSANDLPSIRIRASASASLAANASYAQSSLANSTTITPSVNNRLSGIERSSEKQSAENSNTTTAARNIDSQQQRVKAESSMTLLTGSSSLALQDLGTSMMNTSDGSIEGDAGRSHRERRFRRLFRNVPTNEMLLCRYSCAYVSAGLLLQGHLYVSDNWICFHSNVFGIEKIIEVPADSVISVSKAHTAKIIPNAVRIKTEGKYYLFGSLISRDNTYRLLVNVTSRGRSENGASNKHDFTGGPYGNVSRTLRDCAELDDASSSSSLTTESSSSSPPGPADDPAAGQKSKTNRSSAPAIGLAAVEEPEPVVWRRLFHSGGETQRSVSVPGGGASGKEKMKGNGVRKSATDSSVPSLLTWFFGLPKTLLILIICVGLVMFLFMCATVLTIRLIYVRSSNAFRMDLMPWDTDQSSDSVFMSTGALDDMDNLLDQSLKVMDEVKRYLASLQVEVRNGLSDDKSS